MRTYASSLTPQPAPPPLPLPPCDAIAAPEAEAWRQRSVRVALDEAPACPGVYIFLGEDGRTLYVGKSVNVRARVRSYFALSAGPHSAPPARGLPVRLAALAATVRGIECVATPSGAAALLLEASLVRARSPPFNVLLKDDAGRYPYVGISWSQPYPHIFVTRTPRRRALAKAGSALGGDDGGGGVGGAATGGVVTQASGVGGHKATPSTDVFLGPFTDAAALRELLALVKVHVRANV